MVSLQAFVLAAALAGSGDLVLLDFGASWCAPCRSMEPTIARLEQAGYPVRRVDVEAQPDLARRFGIGPIPCFVLVRDGREVQRIVGGTSYEQLVQLFQQAGPAAIANNGIYLTPHVVDYLRARDTGEITPIQPSARTIPVGLQQNWEDVRAGMLHVLDSKRGTAKRIRSDRYAIAGKTGTAQVFTVAQDEEYDEETLEKKLRDHALFIAYAPADDPQIAVAVVVENGGHGGSVAAPIARQIMDAYLLPAEESVQDES